FLVWILVHLMYRVRKTGLEHIPAEGPAVLVCNHVSFVDALIIAGCVRRPVRFVMDHHIFHLPVLRLIFNSAGAIPIASARENPELLEQAFARISEYLDNDEIVCIFPEGKITRDGTINPFRSGIERIVASTPVVVVPMALRGLWGSWFSRRSGHAMSRWPRPHWRRIELVAGAPVAPSQVSATDLQHQVTALRGDLP
ncbi:MAG: 1-acyl-sn-glycerol-3-phosphate acyltransferase, partial [Candidatus Competibacteraceae bacterium]|nr:1-acyl-sn-glycerol-3-phosphate acyltransferase [Candidatus Competibacteraceae bacterium]